jgi:hypothetical protein
VKGGKELTGKIAAALIAGTILGAAGTGFAATSKVWFDRAGGTTCRLNTAYGGEVRCTNVETDWTVMINRHLVIVENPRRVVVFHRFVP